jgi:hypothetical protein
MRLDVNTPLRGIEAEGGESTFPAKYLKFIYVLITTVVTSIWKSL